MNLTSEGRVIYDAEGRIVALCQESDIAGAIVNAVNDAGRVEPAVSELMVACGLDFMTGWPITEALAQATGQVRQVRRTMQTRQFDHHSTR